MSKKYIDMDMSDGGGGDWVRLEVGGRIIATSRTTLTSCPSSVLARMFRPGATMEPAALSPEGNYRIDCDPDIFAVILNWLRHGQFSGPSPHEYDPGGSPCGGRILWTEPSCGKT